MKPYERALELAERGRGKVGDHPLVGAVVVVDDEVVGEGWYEYDLVRHAEVAALEQAANRARGATLYVTLEPCSHQGRTPPCADAVVAAVAAAADLVLCMSIHPGYSGQEFMPDAVERIGRLRAALPDHVYIQVDGGIDDETIGPAHEAGADLLVAGSAIFGREDPPRAYRQLVQALA